MRNTRQLHSNGLNQHNLQQMQQTFNFLLLLQYLKYAQNRPLFSVSFAVVSQSVSTVFKHFTCIV